LLGFLLFKSRLVPRALSLIGLVGGPVLIAGYLAILFGLIGQHAPLAGLSAVPVALFEFSLGVWLTVKGFNKSAASELLNDRSSPPIVAPIIRINASATNDLLHEA
jgi:hypothetical protein